MSATASINNLVTEHKHLHIFLYTMLSKALEDILHCAIVDGILVKHVIQSIRTYLTLLLLVYIKVCESFHKELGNIKLPVHYLTKSSKYAKATIYAATKLQMRILAVI